MFISKVFEYSKKFHSLRFIKKNENTIDYTNLKISDFVMDGHSIYMCFFGESKYFQAFI